MKNLCKLFVFSMLSMFIFSIVSCGGGGGNDTSKTIASMRVVQSPVANAIVCIDENQNKLCDPNETQTMTDANGYFSLNIPDDASGLLCTQGGTLILPDGSKQLALTLLAPPTAKNITPLTTLVALNPNLLPKIEALGESYDVDIAKGVKKDVLALALGIENTMYSVKTFTDPWTFMLGVSKILEELSTQQIDIESLKTAVVLLGQEEGVEDLTNIVAQGLDSIKNQFASIQDDIIEENEIIASLPIYISAYLVLDLTNQILPVPNDVLWAESDYKVKLPTTSDDLAKNLLYSSINKLEISGLSPNSPIAIPLSTEEELDITSVIQNILLIDLNKFQIGQQDFLITNLEFSQNGSYLKIYPLTPLDPGHKYLVVLTSGIKFKNGVKLDSSLLFELLKSDNPITSEELLPLEPLRGAYSDLFSILSQYFNIAKEDILELFTFTTAEKTLSLEDFGLIQAALQDGTNADNYLSQIQGLNLEKVTTEFYQINNAIQLLKGSSVVNSTAFTSFDITTLTQRSPTPVPVPYKIYNGSLYSGTILIFQHGLGGQKEAAQTLSMKISTIPIIAMDLPEHGERSTGDKSGANYLTGDIGRDRVDLYQSFFDIGMFLNLIKDGKFDFDGDGNPDQPSNIYYVGQSMGSITGSVATSLNNDTIDKIVLNVGGANFAALVDQATNDLIQGLLQTMGLTEKNTEYFVTLGILQLLLDPCDPVYLANDSIKNKVMLQSSYRDTIVPNISNKILANKIGFDTYVTITPSSSDPTDYNNWFMFMGSGDKNWITHGILLGVHPEYYPEAANYLDDNNLQWAYDTVNDFIINYLQ